MSTHRRVVERGTPTRWTAFTPTWNNVTVGNAVQDFVWGAVPGGFRVRGLFRFGSTSAFTGTVSMTLPNSVTSVDGLSMGAVQVLDSGTRVFAGTCIVGEGSGTVTPVVADGASYLINSSSPMTWATNDELRIDITVGVS